jgi:hypothetical protein
MHMHAAGIDLEVETYSTKLANETSPWTPMHEIKRGILARTVPTTRVIHGVKKYYSVFKILVTMYN